MSRYIQLATLFRRRIESHEWVPGQRIATVNELAAEFGVAGATIRQALGILHEEGLIDSFRAKGTFVRGERRERLWSRVATDWAGLLQPTEGASIEVLQDTADVALPPLPYLFGEPAEAYRHLRRRHSRKNEPFMLASIYVDERLRSETKTEDIYTKTALMLVASLRDKASLHVRQTITVSAADVETAPLLQVPLNAPVAIVHRRVVDSAGILILAAEGIYRGDTVRIDIELN